MAENRVIGHEGVMPWHLPADLKHFKALTLGKPVLMGRRTFAALGKALPGRPNIVLTRDTGFAAAGVQVVHTFDDAIAAAGDVPELMVIGGGEIYALALPRADRVYLTHVAAQPAGDAHFPPLDPRAWRETSRAAHVPDERNQLAMTFVTLERVR